MSVGINNSGKDVIASGVFLTFDKNEPTVLTLDIKGVHLHVKISFVDDIYSPSSSPRMDIKPEPNDTLSITFYNIISSMGAGSTNPIKIGSVDGEELFLELWLYAMDRHSQKKVVYTFYLGGKENA